VDNSIGAAVSPDSRTIYIPNRSNHVEVVDAATGAVTGSVFVNGGQFGVSVTADGKKVYARITLATQCRSSIRRR
jgi:DNA-binding beta-propeller fold protein YncE